MIESVLVCNPTLLIADCDTVTLRGAASNAAFRVGFGSCTGRVLPSAGYPALGKGSRPWHRLPSA